MSVLKSDRLTYNQVVALEGELKEVPGYPGIFAAPSGVLYSKSWRAPEFLYRINTFLQFGILRVNVRLGLRWKVVQVARLVAAAYLSTPEGDKRRWVCYHNGNSLDCRVENLYYYIPTTAKKKGYRKLTKDDVAEIRRLLADGDTTQYEIAERYGVHHTLISAIKKNRRHEDK